jgi:hypothetical protein
MSSYIEMQSAEGVPKSSAATTGESMQDLRDEVHQLGSVMASFVEVKTEQGITKVSPAVLKRPYEEEIAHLNEENDALKQDIAAVQAENDAFKMAAMQMVAMGGRQLPTASSQVTVAAPVLTAQPTGLQGTIVAPESSQDIIAPSYSSDTYGSQFSFRRPEQRASTTELRRQHVSSDRPTSAAQLLTILTQGYQDYGSVRRGDKGNRKSSGNMLDKFNPFKKDDSSAGPSA